MKAVSTAVLKEAHPLPTLERMTAHMRLARYFSVLDIAQAFHQVKVARGSRYVTTFRTHRGLYRYCRLMFGLSSAAEIFQRIVETILKGLDGVVVYVDDIIVIERTLEEHDRRLPDDEPSCQMMSEPSCQMMYGITSLWISSGHSRVASTCLC